jgi:hypothetical protein
VNFWEASKIITHKHELAPTFESALAAEQIASPMNDGRPEAMYKFRVEQCKKCERFHIRRGPNVFIKSL